MLCPLCSHDHCNFFHRDRKRHFFHCPICSLVFVAPAQLPSPTEEKARYLLHRNEIADQGYIRFLQTFIQPLKLRITKDDKGIDFGSGPNPVMVNLLRQEDYCIAAYDPFFANNLAVLDSSYDYLTCVETVEHFHEPRREWNLICRLVKPGGMIGVKTSLLTDKVHFPSWYYKGDPTHVCFYSVQTFGWIGQEFNLQVEVVDHSTVFLTVTE